MNERRSDTKSSVQLRRIGEAKDASFNHRSKEYLQFLLDLKTRIKTAQVQANLSVNAELIQLYWDIGSRILDEQKARGWGAAVIPQLAKDLRNDLPEVKGFSERNLKYMLAFVSEYQDSVIVQQPVAQLGGSTDSNQVPQSALQRTLSFLARIPWGHHIILMEKIKKLEVRLWYMDQTLQHGWSRNVLHLQIESGGFQRRGRAITNFDRTLPPVQSGLASQTLKDPYIFDFLTLQNDFRERELETGLLEHLTQFLIELGSGFAYVGRQVRMEVGNEDYYVDLLFYHLKLRCYVVIDLKKGVFLPAYAGKMNFYLNVVDDRVRNPEDKPSIGLILCQDKNRVVAEYALRGIDKAIGVSGYQLTRALPPDLKSSLPTIEEIEAELEHRTHSKNERNAIAAHAVKRNRAYHKRGTE